MAELEPALMGGIVAGRWALDPVNVKEVFMAFDLECAILRSPMRGFCCYVKVPADRLEQLDVEEIPCPGGITYGPDVAGWIGFDTGHAWDEYIPDSPGETRSPDVERRERLIGPPPSYAGEDSRFWTSEELRDATVALAAMIHAGVGCREE